MNAIIAPLATAMTTALTPTKTTFRLMAGSSSGQQRVWISAAVLLSLAIFFTTSTPVVIVVKTSLPPFRPAVSRTRQAGRVPSRSSQKSRDGLRSDLRAPARRIGFKRPSQGRQGLLTQAIRRNKKCCASKGLILRAEKIPSSSRRTAVGEDARPAGGAPSLGCLGIIKPLLSQFCKVGLQNQNRSVKNRFLKASRVEILHIQPAFTFGYNARVEWRSPMKETAKPAALQAAYAVAWVAESVFVEPDAPPTFFCPVWRTKKGRASARPA